eukprot:TRINITY_DN5404_c0_g1_i2.p5 TRINITY_DN5404_c0_g1~~TRINITY_DN5404_c0_g1_i2.p5  ORF type:complete len:125 (+),score=41.64 TRINITY_DN5404_c0_g1_i2:646-1020(+)
MVLTPLLLTGSTPTFRRFFNLLAEEPATVAAALVPRVRAAAVRGAGLGRVGGFAPAVRYLTGLRAVGRLVVGGVLGLRRGRYFDADGRRVLRGGIPPMILTRSACASSGRTSEGGGRGGGTRAG